VRAGAIALAIWSLASPARAHLGSTKYVRIDRTLDGAFVVADVDPQDIAYDLDLDATDADDVIAAPGVRGWAERAFAIRSAAGVCRGRAGAPRVVRLTDRVGPPQYVRVPLRFHCPTNHRLVFHDASVFGSDPQHEAIVHDGERETILRVGRQDAHLAEVVVAGGCSAAPSNGGALALFALALVSGASRARRARCGSRACSARSHRAARARAAC
jgi:hypothetical protein